MASVETQPPISTSPTITQQSAAPLKKHYWRGIMGKVAELCGVAVAQAMMDTMSGVRFYVPKQYTGCGPMAVLSREHAEALIAELGGEIIYVPSAMDDVDIKEQRFQEVERLVQAGVSTAQIANKLNISQTYVFALRREFGAPSIREIRKRQKAALSITG